MGQTWSQERGVNPTELVTKNGEEGVRDAEKKKDPSLIYDTAI